MALSRAALLAELNTLITDPLNRQNTAARVRQILADIINSTDNLLDDVQGFSGWTNSTGLNSIIANNGTPNIANSGFGIIGGKSNSATTGYFNAIVNGEQNNVSNYYSIIGNGFGNKASGNFSLIGNGKNNNSSYYYSSVLNGNGNTSSYYYSSVLNGNSNLASNKFATVINGSSNTATSSFASILNGRQNNTYGTYATILNGRQNKSSGTYSAIVNGVKNKAINKYSLIGSGYKNEVTAKNSFIVTGAFNAAYNLYSGVVGGKSNAAKGNYTTILNGTGNVATKAQSTVINGNKNTNNGTFSTILGGHDNTLNGDNSFILGSNITGNLGNTTYIENARLAETTGTHIYSAGTALENIFLLTNSISGTTNYLPVFTSTNAIGNSILMQSTLTGLTVFGSVDIYGDVSVLGTATTFNTTTVQTTDNNITLNLSGSHLSSLYGGITILSGTPSGDSSTWTIDANGAWSANTGIYTSAITVSGTITSGSTDLSLLFATPANITQINSQLNTKANLSGATFTGNIFAPVISASTFYSGSTNLYNIFQSFPVVGYETTNTATTINISTYDVWCITGLTSGNTINVTGTPYDAKKIYLLIKDNGISQALTFGTGFTFSTYLPAPAATTAGKLLKLYGTYSYINSKVIIDNWQDGF